MRKIILASHGDFSKGLKNSVSMIVGDLANEIETYSLYPSENPRDYMDKKSEEIQKNPETQFIFLCDIKGGSVHTALSQLCCYKNVVVISGTNMNLVLDLLLSVHEPVNEVNGVNLLDNAKEGLTFITSNLLKDEEDEEF